MRKPKKPTISRKSRNKILGLFGLLGFLGILNLRYPIPVISQDDSKAAGATTGGTSSPAVTVPSELRKQHPDLIDLILTSESMDDEERQYWINILPVMTSEQRENLRGILKSEREQLAAIDAKYQKEVSKLSSAEEIATMGQKRQESRVKRHQTEGKAEQEEAETEEEILKKIEGQGGA